MRAVEPRQGKGGRRDSLIAPMPQQSAADRPPSPGRMLGPLAVAVMFRQPISVTWVFRARRVVAGVARAALVLSLLAGCGAVVHAPPAVSVRVVEIVAGSMGSCARISDGSVACWGTDPAMREPRVRPVRQAVPYSLDLTMFGHTWCSLAADAAYCSFTAGVEPVYLVDDVPVTLGLRGYLAGEHSVVEFTEHGCVAGVCPPSPRDVSRSAGHYEFPAPSPPVPFVHEALCTLAEEPELHHGAGFISADGALWCLPVYGPFERSRSVLRLVAGEQQSACAVYADGVARCVYPALYPLSTTDVTYEVPFRDILAVDADRCGRPPEHPSPRSDERSSLRGCVLREGGSVWCWGGNGCDAWLLEGAIPNDCTWEEPLDPVEVELGVAATQIAVGGAHACALLVDGSVWCWGLNFGGQLGNGTRVDSATPVQVLDLPGAP